MSLKIIPGDCIKCGGGAEYMILLDGEEYYLAMYKSRISLRPPHNVEVVSKMAMEDINYKHIPASRFDNVIT